MGPQSEGNPPGDGRNYGGQYVDDGRQYQTERAPAQDQIANGHGEDRRWQQTDREPHMPDAHLPPPNGAFGMENRMHASPAGSASGREGDGPKTSGERNRSRTRNGRTGSGQIRICKKCGEPLTGQFVRALGGTYHLECFRCRVSVAKSGLVTFANKTAGLWSNCCIKILSCRR